MKNFKWNQSYLSPGLNLSWGSNSLNSASGTVQFYLVKEVETLQLNPSLETLQVQKVDTQSWYSTILSVTVGHAVTRSWYSTILSVTVGHAGTRSWYSTIYLSLKVMPVQEVGTVQLICHRRSCWYKKLVQYNTFLSVCGR